MGIPFTLPMGFLFTVTMGILLTIGLGIQLTISRRRDIATRNHSEWCWRNLARAGRAGSAIVAPGGAWRYCREDGRPQLPQHYCGFEP